jgi:hypothetical protein
MTRLFHLSMLFAILTQCNAQEFKSNLALTSGKSSFNMPFEFVRRTNASWISPPLFLLRFSATHSLIRYPQRQILA